MDKINTAMYDSIACYVPFELQGEFVEDCKSVGLDAGYVKCFSKDSPDYVGIFRKISEKLYTFAPLLLNVLEAFQKKHSVDITVSKDGNSIKLNGYSSDDALKILAAADSMRFTQSSKLNSPDNSENNK
ncbi:hypothetical protein KWG64_15765 [Rahnella sp. PD12R]|uniref:hypothetical protein n=1 Tax=Rahnella sp. PD12R TaxID=2855688 RepID=UPI001C464718|nr:hypothetical protein [Rahnella sp. PD12R]MBV6819398.1 hypothetical protein [Rahnella sp. PD12R]